MVNIDLAYKTARLVQESASTWGLGGVIKSVTFDLKTLEGLRGEPGTDEGKVFNLIRGLNKEIDGEPDLAPVLLSSQGAVAANHRRYGAAEHDRPRRKDRLAALAAERDQLVKAAKESGLSPTAFTMFWRLKEDPALLAAEIDPRETGARSGGVIRPIPERRRQRRRTPAASRRSLSAASRSRHQTAKSSRIRLCSSSCSMAPKIATDERIRRETGA
jgi:type I restriction enzyme R subunit